MLDTNIVSDLVKNPAGMVAQRIRQVGEAGIGVSIIIAAELRFGGLALGSPAFTRKVEGVLSRLIVAPFESPADLEYAKIRLALKRRGLPIGPNDLFIAAHAVSLNVPLVTRNVAEFRRVSGLSVENWLQ